MFEFDYKDGEKVYLKEFHMNGQKKEEGDFKKNKKMGAGLSTIIKVKNFLW